MIHSNSGETKPPIIHCVLQVSSHWLLNISRKSLFSCLDMSLINQGLRRNTHISINHYCVISRKNKPSEWLLLIINPFEMVLMSRKYKEMSRHDHSYYYVHLWQFWQVSSNMVKTSYLVFDCYNVAIKANKKNKIF